MVFWLHVQHVIYGQNGYDSDVYTLDKIIGLAHKYFSDDEVEFSADHHHMNGWGGKYNDGLDTHDSAIRIPVITPMIENKGIVDALPSTVDVFRMLTQEKIITHEYIISDTAHYVQPNRKIAITKGQYTLTYEKETKGVLSTPPKQTKRFGLYDTECDPEEDHNL